MAFVTSSNIQLSESIAAAPLSRKPFLAPERPPPGEAFLELNSQADYGGPSRSLFWRLNYLELQTSENP
jgi:hypothetical protein